ncbi:MAG: PAS domain S-box protein [Candidatus Hodarchaeales archaeon]
MPTVSNEDEDAIEHFRRLFRQFPKGFALAITDTFSPHGNRRVLWSNKAFQKFFGYSKEEVCQLDPQHFWNLPQQERTRWLEVVIQQGFVEDFRVTLKTKQGQSFVGYGNAVIVHHGQRAYLMCNVCHTLEESQAFNRERKFRFIQQN